MTIQQAMSRAREMTIPGVRGLGTMSLRAASGNTYYPLTDALLLDAKGKEVEVADVTEQIESVTTTTDESGAVYVS